MITKLIFATKSILVTIFIVSFSYIIFAFLSPDPWFLLGSYIPTTIDNITTTIKRQTPVEAPVDLDIIGEIVDLDYYVYTPDQYALTILFAYPKTDNIREKDKFSRIFYGHGWRNNEGKQIYPNLNLAFRIYISQKNNADEYIQIADEYKILDARKDSFTVDNIPRQWIGQFIFSIFLEKGMYKIKVFSEILLPENLRTSAKFVIRRDYRKQT